MKLKVYCWYDSKTESFGLPMFFDHRGNASRFFVHLVGDLRPENNVARFPADYTFFEIGEYDLLTGNVLCYESKVNLGLAVEYKEKQPGPEPVAN